MAGHEQHTGRPGRVDEPDPDRQERAAGGRADRAGLALGVIVGAAVAWNLAANLWLPWALYVPGGLLLAAILIGVAVKISVCRLS